MVTHKDSKIFCAIYDVKYPPQTLKIFKISSYLKNGHQFTFKTDSKDFFRLDNEYSKHNIQAKDRRKYEELFEYRDYLFEEIVSIKYGKQEIYSR